MESLSEPSCIQCSENTYKLLAETGRYTFTERGEIEVKGKGLMRTYWLESSLLMESPEGQLALARVIEMSRELLSNCPVERSYEMLKSIPIHGSFISMNIPQNNLVIDDYHHESVRYQQSYRNTKAMLAKVFSSNFHLISEESPR